MLRGVCGESNEGAANRGQSTAIGAILVLGMVVAGVVAVVSLGATALSDTQDSSELERGENTMTLFNTRASMVALGNSPTQTVAFGRDSGTIESDPSAGWMRITHGNFTAANGTEPDNEIIFNKTLGAVIYTNGEKEIAYQGGGVWKRSSGGFSQMVSPPEFHYRSATLTLPVVRVDNADSGAGSTIATITQSGETRRVFPNVTAPTPGVNETGAPYNGTDAPYENPVANGTVNVTVKSEYYQGWATYFRDRTDGNVTVYDDRNRVRVTLESLSGSPGDFEMPPEGTGLSVSGVGEDHPLDEYTLNLSADGNFQNMHWSFYEDSGSEKFELHFYSDDQCKGNPSSYDGNIDVSIYYYNSTGPNTIHEEWQNMSVNVSDNTDSYVNDFHVDCNEGTLNIDLMGDTSLAYGDIVKTGSTNKWKLADDIDEPVSASTNSFTLHDPDSGNYTTGDEERMSFLVNHYVQLLGPEFNLEVTDGPGGSERVDEGASSGSLSYDAEGTRYVTFLHVTENVLNVDFD